MTDQIESYLRDLFGAEAESAPIPRDLAGVARRQVHAQRRRWATVLGAGLGVLALVAGIVTVLGAGDSHSPPARDPVPTPSSTPLSPQAELFFSSVEHVDSLLGETPKNVARLELRRQRAYVECMRTSGFQYAITKVRPQPTFYRPSWWERPSLRDAEKGLGYAVLPQPEPASPPMNRDASTDKFSYDGAFDVCTKSVNFRPEFSDPPNAAAQALLYSLTDTLFSAASSPGFEPTRSRYANCLKSQGIDVREPSGLYDIAEEEVGALGVNSVDAYSAAYRVLLPKAKAAEVRIGKADVTCRLPLADDIARLLSPPLDNWSARNSKQIRAAAKGW